MKKTLLIALVVLLAAGAGLAVYNGLQGKRSTSLHATGVIEGIEVNVSSKVAGRIAWLCCSEGASIKEGAPLATIEGEDIKASVAQALAGVERARADIRSFEAAIDSSRANLLSADADIRGSDAEVQKAKAQLDEAQLEAGRAEQLVKNDYISKQQRDQTVSAYQVSVAAYESAKERLNSTRPKKAAAAGALSASISQLGSSRARLREAEAALALNQSKLDDLNIASPITGTVIFKAAERGEMASPGAAILTLVDMGQLYARADIDETRIGAVMLNSPASITVEGIGGKVFKGHVSEVGRHAEFATQRDVIRGREDIKTFRVKVAIDDAEGVLKPGMTVEVAIPKAN